MARKNSNNCEHGVNTHKCKQCKTVYDKAYAAKALQKYKEFISKSGCLVCGFNHPDALDVHHLASSYKRYGRSQSHQANTQDLESNKAVLLCCNCHSIFHGFFGGRMKPFPLLTPMETKEIINLARRKS